MWLLHGPDCWGHEPPHAPEVRGGHAVAGSSPVITVLTSLALGKHRYVFFWTLDVNVCIKPRFFKVESTALLGLS